MYMDSSPPSGILGAGGTHVVTSGSPVTAGPPTEEATAEEGGSPMPSSMDGVMGVGAPATWQCGRVSMGGDVNGWVQRMGLKEWGDNG